MSPTQRTNAYYRERGWIIGTVERYVPRLRKKFDLFSAFDSVAVSPDGDTHFIQIAHGVDHLPRLRKIFESEAARRIINCESDRVQAVVFTWRKGKENGRKGGRTIWKPRIQILQPWDDPRDKEVRAAEWKAGSPEFEEIHSTPHGQSAS